MNAVVVVTVMCIMLFVLHMYMLTKCEGARGTEMPVSGMEKVWLW